MVNHIFGIIYTILILAGMVYFFQKKSKDWDEREYFHFFKGDWGNISILAFTVSIVARTLIVHYAPATPEYILIPTSIAIFALAFSAWTDAWSGHAPLEVAWLGIGLTIPFMLYSFFVSQQGLLGFVSVLVWGGICFFLYFNRGVGDADVRILWLVNTATVWFVGLYWSAIIFALAALIQILVHIYAKVFKHGRERYLPYTKRQLRTRLFWSKVFKNIDTNLEGKTHRAVVFLPTLGMTYIVALVILLSFRADLLLVNAPVLMGIPVFL